MGIPNLIAHLQPYAKSGPLVGDAVIDGPGFAYHVFFICLNNRPTAKNAFEASPTYNEIGRTAVAWLDGLVTSEMKMYVAPEALALLLIYTARKYTSTVIFLPQR